MVDFPIRVVVKPDAAVRSIVKVERGLDNASQKADKLRQTIAKAFVPVRFEIARDSLNQGRIRIKGVSDQVARLRRQTTELNRTRLTGFRRAFDRVGRSIDVARRKSRQFFQGTIRRARSAKIEIGGLQSVIAAIGTGFAIRGIVGIGRGFQNLERRIRSVSGSAEEVSKNLSGIRQVSDETGTSIEANAAVFARLTIGTRRFGVTADRVIGIVRTLNQAFVIGGSSAQETRSAITQLGQALASGRLQGDELRSLSENASFLFDKLAKQIGVPVGELKKLGAEGKLTSEVLVRALEGAALEIGAEFDKLGPSLDQSIERLKNSLIEVGEEFQPFIQNLSTSIEFLARLTSGVGGLLGQFRRQPGGGADEEARVGAASQTFLEELTRGGASLLGISTPQRQDFAVDINRQSERDLFDFESQRFANQIQAIDPSGDLDAQISALRDRLKEANVSSDDLSLAFDLLKSKGSSLIERQAVAADLFGLTANVLVEVKRATTDVTAAIDENVSAVISAAEAEATRKKAIEDVQKSLGKQVESLRGQKRLLQEEGIERAVLSQLLRAESSLRKSGIDIDSEAAQNKLALIDFLARENAEKKIAEQVIRALRTEEEKRAETIRKLNELLKEGVITETQRNAAIGKAATDILTAQTRALENQTRVIEAERDSRAALAVRISVENQLRRAGIVVTEEAIQKQLESIEASAQANNSRRFSISLLNRIQTADEKRAELTDRINKLQAEGIITAEQRNRLLAELPELATGLDAIALKLERANDSAQRLGASIGDALVSGIDKASGALAEFALSGARDVDALREAMASILSDIAQDIVKAIIKALILKAITESIKFFGSGGAPTPARTGASANASRQFLVNEAGPELFVPQSSPLAASVAANRARTRTSSSASRFATRQTGGSVQGVGGLRDAFIPGDGSPTNFSPPSAGQIVPAAQTAAILNQETRGDTVVVQAAPPIVETKVNAVIMLDGEIVQQAIRGNESVQTEIIQVVRDNQDALDQGNE